MSLRVPIELLEGTVCPDCGRPLERAKKFHGSKRGIWSWIPTYACRNCGKEAKPPIHKPF